MEVPPLLVQVLGGNAVTAASALGFINTADANRLRRLHPVLAVIVAGVRWADTTTAVRDADRWHAALPAATALRWATGAPFPRGRALTALGGVAVLDLAACDDCVTDAVVARLPPTLRALNVSMCQQVTKGASFMHLAALESLDCSYTNAVAAGPARLPPSLRELHIRGCEVPATANFSHLCNLRVVKRAVVQQPFSTTTVGSLPPSLEVLVFDSNNVFTANWARLNFEWPPVWSLAHLTRLRVLNAEENYIHDGVIAALPPSLHVLTLGGRNKLKLLSSTVSFAHLTCLHTLHLRYAPISAATLASLPPSLVSFDLHCGAMLTPDTVFPHLPVLRVLNVDDTDIGDAAVTSMPAGLEELSMIGCSNVTRRARLDHLTALKVLQCVGTGLPSATIAACRARGCFAPTDGQLALKGGSVDMLVPLPDGRLLSGTRNGRVVLCEAAAGRDAVAELELPGLRVNALAVLRDGHRVAVGTTRGIVVWDTREVLHDTNATIACGSAVQAMAVAHNGHIVAGCEDGNLHVVDVDTGNVVATLDAHDKAVRAVVVLQDGRVASVSREGCMVWLWDMGTGAWVSMLEGHANITALAVLPDGRLASASQDDTVRLWDTARRTCIRVLTGHTEAVYALAVLPDDWLASVSGDGTIRVWDTCDDAGGAGGSRARPPLEISFGSDIALGVLTALPGNRLAAGGGSGVYLWQLPHRAT